MINSLEINATAPLPETATADKFGAFFAFAATKAERAQTGDPRPSLQERYANRAE